MTGAHRPTADEALARVGLDRHTVLELGGSVLDAGRPFLVGSLAAGMGNQGSDVDIHLLVDGLDRPTPPFLLFSGDTPVDIEHVPATMPARALAKARGHDTVDSPLGPVSLGPPPDRSLRRRLARWVSALPLRDDADRIYEESDAHALLPVLVRAALDEFVLLSAMASVAERAGVAPDRTAYLWSRAGRHLLEVRCRAAGDVMTGAKWLPGRAGRLGVPAPEQRAHYTARTAADLAGLARSAGLADWDWVRLVRVSPDPRCTTLSLGRQRLRVTGHQRVLRTTVDAEGPLEEVLETTAPPDLLSAVTRGELTLEVDQDRMGEELRHVR
ncbi:hypothetical protein ACIRD2_27370 [Streptomyces sp. NPDC093595]|uniref:hypothetical protein n=1 Tax=Streptomyces sp. NPDC093595 TaxID=3366045 RepID=UPI00381A33B3